MIFAHQPIITRMGKSVNVQFHHEGRELSLCCDDSCGRLGTLSRADIALFTREGDQESIEVTYDIFPGTEHSPVRATVPVFNRAMAWLTTGE